MVETERRKHFRSKDSVIITIEGNRHETKNLSESGAMFYAKQEYEKDRIYDIFIDIRNIEVKAKIHIAHITPHHESNITRYGIEFLYDKSNERKLVQKFIYSRGYSEGVSRRGQFKGGQKPWPPPKKI